MDGFGRPLGSSPHAGSRLGGVLRRLRSRRLIPARGESTAPSGPRHPPSGAHPRTRGVDRIAPWTTPAPPWLIPARGESTRPSRRTASTGRAHPRTRGVDAGGVRGSEVPEGSSPHAGSRRAGLDATHRRGGLIPARGESTCAGTLRRSSSPAHPRTRGVDLLPWIKMPNAQGSSPHAGSRPDALPGDQTQQGLIPAGGESTAPGSTSGSTAWAHPRTRGVDDPWAAIAARKAGSSPHAGSRRGRRLADVLRPGLIPARGESTSTLWSPRDAMTAHPRTRGVDGITIHLQRPRLGSSPHAGSRPGPQ